MKRFLVGISVAALLVLGVGIPARAALPGEVDRLAGADRYSTSVAISQQYSAGVPVVYIAAGTAFPDGLSAAPAAAAQGGPLLLTAPNQLPAVVRDELLRLQPQKIVVVGGTGAVSAGVYAQLAGIQPEIRRDAGADRYATSRIVNERAFPNGASVVYIASGRDFPDALSSSAAAGSMGGAVLLLDGRKPQVDGGLAELIGTFGPEQIRVAGGTGAVSAGIASHLAQWAPVIRLAGKDRYETSVAISANAFPNATDVSFAAGTGFADALAGAAFAGRRGAPLLVTAGTCLTRSAADLVTQWAPAQRWIFGGAGVVKAGVVYGTICNPAPAFTAPDGLIVGQQVATGTYVSAARSFPCSWVHLNSLNPSPDSVVTGYESTGQKIVTITEDNYGFASDCALWRPIQQAPELAGGVIPGEGVFLTGHQFEPGTYRSIVPPGDGCYWETMSGFEWLLEETMDSGAAAAGAEVTVDITADETGFLTSGCGTWTRIG
ncbi:cell wall-binding repeat-containing protein [Microbacterium stercoris]|uniref:Cell wall-binding repeat-containing protein n=1 Tax=Microbacterium stercoris TaxID=2820289 RepID=A0A939QUN0_9MICO|nr:cell wall-binding repeat-containing protein [Microbacterium stercoris]MBO3664991.1 cell wall-binding repeat-containing protein [Microbacterium stercoris]